MNYYSSNKSMLEQHTITETVSVPMSTLCKTRAQFDTIVQAFVERSFLYKTYKPLQGVIMQITSKCLSNCQHQQHTWLLPRETRFVHMCVEMSIQLLKLMPGDRLYCTVNHISDKGLEFVSSEQLNVFVPETLCDSSPNRSIPEPLWRIGAFATIIFKGVSKEHGLFGEIANDTVKEPVFESEAMIENPHYIQVLSDLTTEKPKRPRKPRIKKLSK